MGGDPTAGGDGIDQWRYWDERGDGWARWVVLPSAVRGSHVLPVADMIEHTDEACPCLPTVEWADPTTGRVYPDGPLVVHHAADRREWLEVKRGGPVMILVRAIRDAISAGRSWDDPRADPAADLADWSGAPYGGRRPRGRFALWVGRRRRARCTGIAATWCPVHGNCTCPPRYPNHPDELIRAERTLDEAACPLHGPRSIHGG